MQKRKLFCLLKNTPAEPLKHFNPNKASFCKKKINKRINKKPLILIYQIKEQIILFSKGNNIILVFWGFWLTSVKML